MRDAGVYSCLLPPAFSYLAKQNPARECRREGNTKVQAGVRRPLTPRRIGQAEGDTFAPRPQTSNS